MGLFERIVIGPSAVNLLGPYLFLYSEHINEKRETSPLQWKTALFLRLPFIRSRFQESFQIATY